MLTVASIFSSFTSVGELSTKTSPIFSNLSLTRVEGENSRLRHYLARLHRKTFCYSKSEEMLRFSIRLLLYYLKYRAIPTLV